MRRLLTFLIALTASAPVSSAQQAFQPPVPGTLITWSFTFGEEKSMRVSEVIASGEDFVIYDPDIRYDANNPEDYVVEFSGVHAQSCDRALPSPGDRQALRALWPFEPGAHATIAGNPERRYEVKAPGRVDFIASSPAATEVRQISSQAGDISMRLSVSPVLGIPVEIHWTEDEGGKVLEVAEPQGSVAPADELSNYRLGACESLLQ